METTYTIEFMRPAEPTIAPIKQPSAFHVAYYCNSSVALINASGNAQKGALLPCCLALLRAVRRRLLWWELKSAGKRKGEERSRW